MLEQSIKTGITLSQLLDGLAVVGPDLNCDVLAITDDSRQVTPGACFVAYPGAHTDGRYFIGDAIARGASVIIYENSSVLPHDVLCLLKEEHHQVSAIPLADCQQRLGVLGARFYGFPSQQMLGIGVTGTNGKSTVAYLIAAIYDQMQLKCGMMGTLGLGTVAELRPSPLTTLGALAMQKELATMVVEGAEAFAFEASSHGLSQARLNGVSIDTAIMTNVAMDHADYHGSRSAYIAAKEKLFAMARRHVVVNFDDPVSETFLHAADSGVDIIGYSTQGKHERWPTLHAQNIEATLSGVTFDLVSPYGDAKVMASLVGTFQVENILAAMCALLSTGHTFSHVVAAIAAISGVPGRMQVFGGGDLPHVVVDYAHTAHALEAALVNLKPFCQQQLWCVFGCGGERDPARRAGMGKVAERYSDQIVITNDNPRHEDPEVISKAIIDSLLCPWAATVELDRCAAIAYAIQSAKPGDVILVAGKGHETTQVIGDEALWHSDIEQVLSQLSVRGHHAL